eukprot:5189096-Amphidinium_carterae.1
MQHPHTCWIGMSAKAKQHAWTICLSTKLLWNYICIEFRSHSSSKFQLKTLQAFSAVVAEYLLLETVASSFILT